MAALAALANSKATLPKYNTPGSSGSGNTNYSFPDWLGNARPQGAQWAASTAYYLQQVIIAPNGFPMQCTSAGTSGTSSLGPAWPTTVGGTLTEGTVSWIGVVNPNPRWLTELNRLRGNLFPVVANMVTAAGGVYPWTQASISGGDATANKVAGWPLAGPSVNNKNLAFWYADTGSAETASISSSGLVQSSGKFSSGLYAANLPIHFTGTAGAFSWLANPVFVPTYKAAIASKTFSVLIGGASPVTVQADFVVPILISRGRTDSISVPPGQPIKVTSGSDGYFTMPTGTGYTSTSDGGAIPSPTFDVSKWMPGSTNSVWTPSSWPSGTGYAYVILRVNGTVSPGRYSVTVSVPTPDDSFVMLPADPASWPVAPAGSYVMQSTTQKSRLLFNGDSTSSFMRGYAYNTFNPTSAFGSGNPTAIASTLGPGVPAPGVHGSAAVLMIDCSGWYQTAPFGIISLFSIENDSNAWQSSPFPQPTFSGEKATEQTVSITTTTTGYWTGNSAAVSNLNPPTPAQMPWNLVRTKRVAGTDFNENPMLLGNLNPSVAAASNSYDQTLPVESQVEPPAWKASTYFSLGFRIMTTYGYIVEVTTAGTSGAAYPGFAATVGGTSTDGTVTWTCKFNPRLPADTWVAGAAYPLGATVYDSNGNQQTSVDTWQPATAWVLGHIMIDKNGNAQQVATAGTTGASQPAWATTAGANTTDGTVTWLCGGATPRTSDTMSEPTWNTLLNGRTTDLLVTWKLTKPNRTWWQPAVHRQQCVPRYPVYWQSESIAALKPPTTSAESEKTIWGCGNQWQRNSRVASPGYDTGWQQDNLAKGWWIYSVSLNRMILPVKIPNVTGAGDAGIGAGDTNMDTSGITDVSGEVMVTIGCIRSGSFVAFGTWATGQTIQVLWPVFTSDALVYQCAERVDIQAVAIASGGAGVSVGTSAAGYPICAAFVSDVQTLLNLIT